MYISKKTSLIFVKIFFLIVITCVNVYASDYSDLCTCSQGKIFMNCRTVGFKDQGFCEKENIDIRITEPMSYHEFLKEFFPNISAMGWRKENPLTRPEGLIKEEYYKYVFIWIQKNYPGHAEERAELRDILRKKYFFILDRRQEVRNYFSHDLLKKLPDSRYLFYIPLNIIALISDSFLSQSNNNRKGFWFDLDYVKKVIGFLDELCGEMEKFLKSFKEEKILEKLEKKEINVEILKKMTEEKFLYFFEKVKKDFFKYPLLVRQLEQKHSGFLKGIFHPFI